MKSTPAARKWLRELILNLREGIPALDIGGLRSKLTVSLIPACFFLVEDCLGFRTCGNLSLLTMVVNLKYFRTSDVDSAVLLGGRTRSGYANSYTGH